MTRIARRATPFLWLLLLIPAWLAALVATRLAAPPQCDLGGPDDLGCARGFETRERDGPHTFRWTDDAAAVLLFGVGYGAPLHAELVLAAPRRTDLPPPVVTISVGADTHAVSVPPSRRRYHLLTHATPLRGDWLELGIRSDTWFPDNRRTLGVQVFHADVRTLGAPTWPGMLLAGGLWLIGLGSAALLSSPHRQLIGALAGIGIGAALWIWLPERAVPLLPGAGLFGLMLVGVRRVWPTLVMEPTPLLVVAVILVNALLDLLIVARMIPGGMIGMVLAAQGAWTFLAVARAPDLRLSHILLIAFGVRLLALAIRLLSGRGATDPDVELFYSYGRATIDLGVPIVEYPSGALIAWSVLAWPASRELFALLLPILNTVCELLAVWAIWRITRPHSDLALFVAISPLLLPFWHGKYDSLPAALIALGLLAWHLGRIGWAGAALGLGGAIKWVPWLAAPFLGWALLKHTRADTQAHSVRQDHCPDSFIRLRCHVSPTVFHVLQFSFLFLSAIALASLPFAIQNLNAFLSPYLVQGNRPMIGESIWFLVALIFEPHLINAIGSPWSGVESRIISTPFMVGVQLLALLGLAGIQILRPVTPQRTLALAALAPVVFLLLNRVFSPQYLTIITIGLVIAGATLPRPQRLILLGLLAIMQTANLLIWPHTRDIWPFASAILFSIGIGIAGWLAARAARA